MKTKVYQLANNQFEISTPKGIYFQSYNSIIAFKPNDNRRVQLDAYYWNYSRTTGKYRNQFLNEGIAETRAKIEAKEYLLTNLNK
tara:strand:- start:186 stop:440 length:255 start_codon:yes stop_codon:yes gene_type:complete